jgi:DNA processing protein
MRYEYSDSELAWIRLSSMEGVGAVSFFKILSHFPDLVYFFSDVHNNMDMLRGQLRPGIIQAIKDNAEKQRSDDFIESLDKSGIHAMTLMHADYPIYLREINNPPPVLYVKGTLKNLTDRTIGIVGTRHCTRRGFSLARDVAKELSGNNVAIISGMARGIDTAAHLGALDAGGVTVAILGCGVDIVYPRENEKLYEAILEKGAVISEYLPGIAPLAQNFPARNRIISGISRGIYVVESSVKGGACITVAYAMNQGRDVFAASGGAFTPTSEFTNALCESGCAQVFDAEGILSEYGWTNTDRKNKISGFCNIQLDFLEQQIYNLLLTGDLTIDEIADKLNIPQNELNIAVTMMEMNGIVKRLPGLQYGLH